MALFTLFILFQLIESRAQYIPANPGDGVVKEFATPPPGPAVRSNNVQNTGTDAIITVNPNAPQSDPNQFCALQVFVWDGSMSGFGWSLGNIPALSGTIYFSNLDGCGTQLHDPDVVITKAKGEIIAVVVGIDEQNFVRTFNFLWNGSRFNFAGNCDCRYGAAWPMIRENIGTGESFDRPQSGFTLGRVCRSPNIDVNEAGDMAIVWVEQEQVRVEAKLGFPFENTSIYQDFTRGNILTAFNTVEDIMEGQHCFRSCENVKPRRVYNWVNYINEAGSEPYNENSHHIFSTIPGIPLYDGEDDELLNPRYWYSSSDVAVSYRDPATHKAVVTYVFYRNNTLGSGSDMQVRQYDFNFCRRERLAAVNYNFRNFVTGVPRIAAVQQRDNQSGNHRDFAIVAALTVANCDSSGYSFASTVRMVGTYAGSPVNGGYAVDLINNQNIKNRSNNWPVVTYAPLTPNGSPTILVAWESIQEVLPAAQTDVEIVAARYAPATFTRIPDQYSIVNFKNISYHGERQIRPSVAGRQLTVDVRSAYFWYNTLSNELSFKSSNSGAGSQAIGGSYCQTPSTQQDPEDMPTGSILVHPNAANQRITIEVKSANADDIVITEIEITDLRGRKVQYHKPTANTGTIEMQLNKRLSKGAYLLHAKTNQGMRTTRLLID
jgi:hypothetical protein